MSDIEWLAGLSDAEACFAANMHVSRARSVLLKYDIGLANEAVMQRVREIVREIVGQPIPELYAEEQEVDEDGIVRQRAFFRCRVTSKPHVAAVLTALLPYLHGKRLEALIANDVASRLMTCAKYAATDLDAELCNLSEGIKHGAPGAVERAEELLGTGAPVAAPSAAWLAGMFDGDGCVSISKTEREQKVYYQLTANIASSDLRALNYTRAVVEAFGIEMTSVSERQAQGGARTGFGFNASAASTLLFLETVLPHLVVKREEACRAIEMLRGELTPENAYETLRALKRPQWVDGAQLEQYRRPTALSLRQRGLLSAQELRVRVGVGHATWKALSSGLAPRAAIGPKSFFDLAEALEHMLGRVDQLGRSARESAEKRLRSELLALSKPLA